MRPENLELVHFQLTRNCNLRCWFCGQWGKKGFFRDAAGSAMQLPDWLRIAEELKSGCEALPSILLWGGEPLLYPDFDALVSSLYQMGFPLGMVTNGTLLDRHLDACRSCFRHIYVSVDGTQSVHDAIRGAGSYQKVLANMQLLRERTATVSLMTVLTQPVLDTLPETLRSFSVFGADEVLLQEQIALSAEEIRQYARWLREQFAQEASEIASWEGTAPEPAAMRETVEQALLTASHLPFSVRYLPHGALCGKQCSSPKHHAHIAWNGNVLFCTDFYDFSAGNVHRQPLLSILRNELSERFEEEIAKGACPACRHCSWRGSTSFRL